MPDKRLGAGAAWTAAGIVIAISLISTFTLATPSRTRIVTLGTAPGGGPSGLPTGAQRSAVATIGPTTGSGIAPITSVGGITYDCSKGQNAGATDVGVTANQIHFAATTVESGPAKDFLIDAKYGILAVVNKVNRSGGICGRQIGVDFRDDSWDEQTGERFIESFIGDKKYFGLAVNPSSEGLRGAIDSGLIDRAQFPVVGADGMLEDQYADPWVWPVATSTASVMHIMARNAYQNGARTFGIVWESTYRFGKEGSDAFIGEVRRLGGTVSSDKQISGGQSYYNNDAGTFVSGCGGTTFSKCDFVAMLLEPATAQAWVNSGGLGDGSSRPRIGIGAPQPLFINSFAQNCAKYCSGMWAWTSFKPPLPPYDGDPSVQSYLADLRAVSASADASNPHVEGAYVGMLLLVDALRQLGPAPTRAGLKRVLDAERLDPGLCDPLRFAAGDHYASVTAQAYADITQNDANGTFANWRYTDSGFISDPDVGKDVSS